MKLKRALCLLSILLAATAISSAAPTVTLTASGSGASYCPSCTGVANLIPLTTTLSGLVNPVQLTLGPGTYIITNADTPYSSGASNEAWNYNTTLSSSWAWAFAVTNASGLVLLNDYVGTSAGTLQYFSTADLAASASGIKTYDGSVLLSATTTAGFRDTLTLSSSQVVNFFIPDSYIGDNAGGIALNVALQSTGTPEPAIPLLIGTGLAALALYRRKRQSRVG
jgi:hypothetical protein